MFSLRDLHGLENVLEPVGQGAVPFEHAAHPRLLQHHVDGAGRGDGEQHLGVVGRGGEDLADHAVAVDHRVALDDPPVGPLIDDHRAKPGGGILADDRCPHRRPGEVVLELQQPAQAGVGGHGLAAPVEDGLGFLQLLEQPFVLLADLDHVLEDIQVLALEIADGGAACGKQLLYRPHCFDHQLVQGAEPLAAKGGNEKNEGQGQQQAGKKDEAEQPVSVAFFSGEFFSHGNDGDSIRRIRTERRRAR